MTWYYGNMVVQVTRTQQVACLEIWRDGMIVGSKDLGKVFH